MEEKEKFFITGGKFEHGDRFVSGYFEGENITHKFLQYANGQIFAIHREGEGIILPEESIDLTARLLKANGGDDRYFDGTKEQFKEAYKCIEDMLYDEETQQNFMPFTAQKNSRGKDKSDNIIVQESGYECQVPKFLREPKDNRNNGSSNVFLFSRVGRGVT